MVRRRLELVQNKFGSGARTRASLPGFAPCLFGCCFPWEATVLLVRCATWWRSSLASSPFCGLVVQHHKLHSDPGGEKEEPNEKDLVFERVIPLPEHSGEDLRHLRVS